MDNEQFVWNVNYLTDRLSEVRDSTEPFLQKLYSIPSEPFTPEELYRLRYLLAEYNSYVTILKRDVEEFNQTPPVPFWKKLFRK